MMRFLLPAVNVIVLHIKRTFLLRQIFYEIVLPLVAQCRGSSRTDPKKPV
jgi:hypothetical protein